eukprot:gene5197-1869_t
MGRPALLLRTLHAEARSARLRDPPHLPDHFGEARPLPEGHVTAHLPPHLAAVARRWRRKWLRKAGLPPDADLHTAVRTGIAVACDGGAEHQFTGKNCTGFFGMLRLWVVVGVVALRAWMRAGGSSRYIPVGSCIAHLHGEATERLGPTAIPADLRGTNDDPAVFRANTAAATAEDGLPSSLSADAASPRRAR